VNTFARHFRSLVLLSAATAGLGATVAAAAPQKPGRLPKPKRLDGAVELHRDAAGELRATPRGAQPEPAATLDGAGRLRTRVNLVEVNCNVLRADGSQVRGLRQDSFRVFEDGVPQTVAHFDASVEPASLVLLIDASPSVLPDLAEMKRAARALAAQLSPGDEVAVATFGGETHLLLPFSHDRVELERAIESVKLDLVGQGSNIYEAIYLAARELFPGRTGRKALLLLTDGQDSGLGLSWSFSSALPHSGAGRDKLSFEDVARALAELGIELHGVSTQPRPRAMTDAWLAEQAGATLLGERAREMGIPHYTLYLAELVRRAGGRLYFLREIGALDEVYRRIAAELGAQYTLGYYPADGTAKPGWRTLRVVVGQASLPVSAKEAAAPTPAAPTPSPAVSLPELTARHRLA
jgi:Ca-activated chloride channel family protein